MVEVLALMASHVVVLGGGGYLGYKYGRKVEMAVQAELNKIAAVARAARDAAKGNS